jgi:hypothetical protein
MLSVRVVSLNLIHTAYMLTDVHKLKFTFLHICCLLVDYKLSSSCPPNDSAEWLARLIRTLEVTGSDLDSEPANRDFVFLSPCRQMLDGTTNYPMAASLRILFISLLINSIIRRCIV